MLKFDNRTYFRPLNQAENITLILASDLKPCKIIIELFFLLWWTWFSHWASNTKQRQTYLPLPFLLRWKCGLESETDMTRLMPRSWNSSSTPIFMLSHTLISQGFPHNCWCHRNNIQLRTTFNALNNPYHSLFTFATAAKPLTYDWFLLLKPRQWSSFSHQNDANG